MFDENTFRGKLQKEELEWVISRIPSEVQTILDAGCGPGRYTQIFAEQGTEVISYDFSRSILKLLQKNLGHLKLTLAQGDIQTLPFKNKQFDAVLMLDVLHHLETKDMRMNAIKEAFRVSKEYVFLDVKNKYNLYLWYRYKKITDPFLRVCYTYSEILNEIRKSGGSIIERKGLGFPIRFIAPYILIEAVKERGHKKILTLTSSFPRHVGDISGNFVYKLANELKERGFEIIFLTPHYPDTKLKEDVDGLKVYRFPYFYPFKYQKLHREDGIVYYLKNSHLAKMQVILLFLSELFYAIKIIRKEKIDIIHSHWLLPQGLVGSICRKIFGIPHITTIHSSEITLIKKIPFGRRIMEFVVNNTDKIVSVSSHRASEVLNFISPKISKTAKEKIDIIPMGVDLSEIRNEINKDELKAKYGINSKFVVLFVGRLVEVNGCEYLIKSFKSVVNKISDVQLIIAGSGSLEFKLKKMVTDQNMEEYIRFDGPVEHTKICDYYSLSDILVFPSIVDSSGFEEGLPVVLLEALVAGKPVVATKTKGVMEVIKDEWNGVLVEQKNSEQIAEKVLELFNDEKLRIEISKNALETAKKYDWDVIAERYSKILTGCTEI
jgi:glycosyltransferase involved in cell wall biosynthesis/ubiquinone/menaquinone biosynthesis C-methylase UbiE